MIRVENLRKSFNNQKVIDDFNLTVETGKTTVILGQSGCGKTVLLKHLIGLLKPDSGKIFFNKERLDKMSRKNLSKIRSKITLVFQKPALFDWLTVFENIALPLREQNRFSENEIKKEVEKKLELVGLGNEENKMQDEISAGMQKRVSIARALVLQPDCILFDEPTTGLDPIIANNIINLFEKMQKNFKTTILIVSHDIGIVFKIADKVAMMKEGKIIFQGSVSKFETSSDKYLKQFHTR